MCCNDKTYVLAGVGTAVSGDDATLAKRLEHAMTQAVIHAQAEGADDAEILRRKLAAKEAVTREGT